MQKQFCKQYTAYLVWWKSDWTLVHKNLLEKKRAGPIDCSKTQEQMLLKIHKLLDKTRTVSSKLLQYLLNAILVHAPLQSKVNKKPVIFKCCMQTGNQAINGV